MSATYLEFNKQLDILLNVTNRSVENILYLQGRLLAIELIDSTPPFGKSQGENAVRRDLGKLFDRYPATLLDKIGADHGLRNINAWYRKSNFQIEILDPLGKEMKKNHYINRSGLRKRVSGDEYKYKRIFKAKTGKGITRQSKYAVTKADYDTYLQYTLNKVGRLKAGWIPAWHALIIYAPGGTKPGQWILRHSLNAKGKYIDNVKSENDSYFLLENNANGINEASKETNRNGSIVNLAKWALRKRAEAIKITIDRIVKQRLISLAIINQTW